MRRLLSIALLGPALSGLIACTEPVRTMQSGELTLILDAEEPVGLREWNIVVTEEELEGPRSCDEGELGCGRLSLELENLRPGGGTLHAKRKAQNDRRSEAVILDARASDLFLKLGLGLRDFVPGEVYEYSGDPATSGPSVQLLVELEDGSDWKLIYASREPNEGAQRYLSMTVALETLLAGEAFVGDMALSYDDGRSFITADMELTWSMNARPREYSRERSGGGIHF